MPGNSDAVCVNCGSSLNIEELQGHCPGCLASAILSPSTGLDLAADLGHLRERIGDYQILEEIGRGGMGVIHRAAQVRLNRIVALKTIRAAGFADDLEIARFRAEAESAASLDHPNIVPIYEIGEELGLHFFSMKLIDGGSLAEHIANDSLPSLRTAAGLIAKVARAVHYAHQHGTLHRDLKPGNILLDAKGEPHVTDFGLARQLGSAGNLTLTGAILGTPNYISPEQAAGARVLTTAADIYSLGAILYELLAGRPPFLGTSVLDILVQVRQGGPRPPHSLNPRVDRDLETVCLKCMEKNPEQRYQTAASLADDLERWLRGEPVTAVPVTAARRMRLWIHRNPAWSAAMGIGAAALLLVTIISTVAAIRLSHERDRTRLAEKDATEKLWQSLVDQARAERLSGLAGSRERACAAVTGAAQIRPSLSLRNEAIAALSLTGISTGSTPHSYRNRGCLPAFDASLKYFAIPSDAGDILIGELQSGKVRFRLPSKARSIGFLAFSPNSRFLGALEDGDTIAMWDLSTQKEIWRDQADGDFNTISFAFHSSEQLVAARTRTNQLRLLDLESGKQAGIVSLPIVPMRFAFSPDGRALVLANGNLCEVWGIQQRRLIGSFSNESCISSLTWHPDGKHVAIGSCSGRVVLWDFASGASIVLSGETEHTAALSFNPAGNLLLSGHDNSISQIWDVTSGERLCLERSGTGMRFSADGKTIAWVYAESSFGLWTVSQPRHLFTSALPVGERPPNELAFSPDGRRLASIHPGALCLWGADTGRLLATAASTNAESNVCFTRDGRFLLTRADNLFWRWLLNDPRDQPPTIGAPQAIQDESAQSLGDYRQAVAFPPHPFPSQVNRYMHAQLIRVADRGYPSALYELKDYPDGVFSVGSTTNWIALCGASGLQIRRLSGTTLSLPTTHPGGLVLLSPDDRQLAHFSSDALEMFATDTGRLVWTRPVRTAATMYPSFSHDGSILAVGGSDSSKVELINPATGEEIAALTPSRISHVSSLAFSPDDHILAVSHARNIAFWDLERLRRQLAELGLEWGSLQGTLVQRGK